MSPQIPVDTTTHSGVLVCSMRANKRYSFVDLEGTFTLRFPEDDPAREQLTRIIKKMVDGTPTFARFNLSEMLRTLIRGGLELEEAGLLDGALKGESLMFIPSSDGPNWRCACGHMRSDHKVLTPNACKECDCKQSTPELEAPTTPKATK